MDCIVANTNPVAELLGRFGVEIAPGGMVVVGDLAKAETAYIHHSSMPVALAAFAMFSPAFARGRFPKTRLADLVAKRPSMDGVEAVALATVCGTTIPAGARATLLNGFGSYARTVVPEFHTQLLDLIDRHDLGAFFTRVEERTVNGIDVRPRGIDWGTEQTNAAELAAWRRAYKALPAQRQMLVATILWLYTGGDSAKLWLNRLPCGWHASEALALLLARDALPDWAKLVALYPGW